MMERKAGLFDEDTEYSRGSVGWGPELTTKKEFLRRLWCKNGGLLKHGDRTCGQKALLLGGCEG